MRLPLVIAIARWFERQRLGGRGIALFLASVASLSACASVPSPSLVSVFPTSGYPRQLIGVNGRVSLASVVWDPGLATETLITNGLAGTTYFQIPRGAAPGAHQVALRNAQGDSNNATVTVIGCDPRLSNTETGPNVIFGPGGPSADGEVGDVGALPLSPNPNAPAGLGPANPGGLDLDPFAGLVRCGAFPGPRIEDIAIHRAIARPSLPFGARANLLFTVSAANLDTDAQVSVAGVGALASCVRWGALPINYLQSHVPITFRYPIYHYTQMLCPLNDVTLGSTINVTVTNGDGKTDTHSYVLPLSLAQLDSDNDGIFDRLEINGAPDVDIAGMGADPLRKTILVEADWTAAGQPQAGIWTAVENAFDALPVLNPDGSAGVDIIIDRGQGGLFRGGGDLLAPHGVMDFGPAPDGVTGYVDFYTYKDDNFDDARDGLFHYAVFGLARPVDSSGRAEIWGNDLMVTFATFTQWPQLSAQVGTFIHELGHNLALRHGGLFENTTQMNATSKPNQVSMMNYRYQFTGVSADCDFTADTPLMFGYSQGAMAQIGEAWVQESTGICDGAPLDINGDGVITSAQMDANQDGDGGDTHGDFDELGNMRLSFRAAPDASD